MIGINSGEEENLVGRRNFEGGKMAREKMSPGVKILWVWTIGTAAILVTNVVRTRLRDMEQMMNTQQQQQQQQEEGSGFPDSVVLDTETDEGVIREVKS